jgi:hypothetical protein
LIVVKVLLILLFVVKVLLIFLLSRFY